MRRREFVGGLVGAAAWPFAARAQQPGQLPTIGLLSASTAIAEQPRRVAFVQRLGELGWAEGRNINIEYRAAEGVVARAGEIAAEFVRLKVDVIVSAGGGPGVSAKRVATGAPA